MAGYTECPGQEGAQGYSFPFPSSISFLLSTKSELQGAGSGSQLMAPPAPLHVKLTGQEEKFQNLPWFKTPRLASH